jgi:hypothetical protein
MRTKLTFKELVKEPGPVQIGWTVGCLLQTCPPLDCHLGEIKSSSRPCGFLCFCSFISLQNPGGYLVQKAAAQGGAVACQGQGRGLPRAGAWPAKGRGGAYREGAWLAKGRGGAYRGHQVSTFHDVSDQFASFRFRGQFFT